MKIFDRFIYILSFCFSFALLLSYLSPYANPQTFLLPIAFLGLFFPFLLFINLLFLFYWLFKFKRHFWPTLTIILIGYNHINTLVKVKDNSSEKHSIYSLSSFNVRLFNVYDWIKEEGIKEEIVSFINQSNSSIVCLQEFYAPNTLPSINYPHSHIGLQKKRSQWRMATYSKYPIIKKGTVSITGENINNVCIFSDIILSEDTVRVYNIHLASNTFENSDYLFIESPSVEGAENIFKRLKRSFIIRATEVNSIKKHMNQSPYPIIVCGDFNDTPLSFAYHQLSQGLNDAFVKTGFGFGRTYNGKFPALRIDYILMSPGFKINNYETLEVELSDHYPISVSFD
jgi:endonuclease/exonuclease/phosphatase family metal-dependent hydrolase